MCHLCKCASIQLLARRWSCRRPCRRGAARTAACSGTPTRAAAAR
uniref:Uncharacterized protein n=1 Tax=Arundo donax TaxID=35708 RepID=A0A0A8Z0Z9_ARUDO